MIIDSVKGFERYSKLHPLFEKVWNYMRKTDFENLAPGKYTIEGTDIYCTLWEGEGKGLDIPKLEVHDSYIDIHLLLEGEETIGHRDRGKCIGENIEYNQEKDIAYLDEAPENFVILTPGNFAMIYPHDAHAPLIGTGKIKKCIFKVKF